MMRGAAERLHGREAAMTLRIRFGVYRQKPGAKFPAERLHGREAAMEEVMRYYGTLGPACGSEAVLSEMFHAGMTGLRLNLSHGDLAESGEWLRILRSAARECEVEPELLIDLQGPELRLGKLDRERTAKDGETLRFGAGGIPVPSVLAKSLRAGDRFLLDDGKLEFEVVHAENGVLEAVTLRGGPVRSGKSIAPEGKTVELPTLTDSDRRNIRLAGRCGVTGVMLPFVRRKEDLLALREELRLAGQERVEVFAKIENLQGVRMLDSLLPYADHIVIARGDLGNSMPLWKLPRVQKEISAACRQAGKPFMVVTQMLDSMCEQAVPTRAEVADIYNAALDGAASLMLTGETAVGKYPAEAMRYLVKTAEEATRRA